MSPESTAADSVRSCSGERRSHVRRRKVADPLARDANVSRGWLLFLRSPNVVDASARVNPRLNPTFCLLPWRDGASSFSVKAAQMSRVHCETAEDSRVHYETDYVEAIGQRMRVPETLKVAGVGVPAPQRPPGAHSALMQVPERIVVAAGDGEARFSCPRDLDLIQCVAGAELLDMKAPPHVLTLAQLPLDSLETRRASEGESEPARTAPPRSGEAAPTRHGRQVIRGDVSVTPSPSAPPVHTCPARCPPEDADVNPTATTAEGFLLYVQSATRRAYQRLLRLLDDGQRRSLVDLALASDVNPDEFGLADASSIRRQIVKLNRRLQMLEEENKERSRREALLYSATVAFWLVNTWVWFRR
ncbi:mitochondrial fission factor homolog A-like isoform X4 [Stigmatopora argus]